MQFSEDQIIEGAALMLLDRYGDRAYDVAVGRAEAMSHEHDALAAAIWKLIANRLLDLQQSSLRH